MIGDSDVDPASLSSLENHCAREEIAGGRGRGEGTGGPAQRDDGHRHDVHGGVGARRARSPSRASRSRSRPSTSRSGASGGCRSSAWRRRWPSRCSSRGWPRSGSTAASARSPKRRNATARATSAGPARDYGSDEIGTVANVLDDTARQLGLRLAEMARERAHMDAILTGMIEGVVLVNGNGRLVLTNPAGRSMLRLPAASEGAALPRSRPAARRRGAARRRARGRGRRRRSKCSSSPARGARSSPTSCRSRASAAAARCSCCTTSPTSGAPTRSAATSSPTSRTSCGRRSRRSAATSRRSSTRRRRRTRRGGFSRSSRATRCAWSASCATCSGWRGSTPDRKPLERTDAASPRSSPRRPRPATRSSPAGGQRLQPTIAPDATVVRGDPAKLHDVLRNLLENAMQLQPAGRHHRGVSAAAHRDAVEITVADRGPGIPEADLDRIFERFYRVDRSRTRDPGGTGLGLSIVRHLVELHGGRVSPPTATAAARSSPSRCPPSARDDGLDPSLSRRMSRVTFLLVITPGATTTAVVIRNTVARRLPRGRCDGAPAPPPATVARRAGGPRSRGALQRWPARSTAARRWRRALPRLARGRQSCRRRGAADGLVAPTSTRESVAAGVGVPRRPARQPAQSTRSSRST